MKQNSENVEDYLARVEKLNQLGIALSAEKNFPKLLEEVLVGAKELTRADAGTLYTVTERNTLKFEIIRTDSLNIAKGGTTGIEIGFPEIPLYSDGVPNLEMVAPSAVLQGTTINIPNAYEAEGYDFSGTRAFDRNNGYRSISFLTVPLKNHDNEVIGVLQLINATDGKTRQIVPFGTTDQRIAESLASQAAMAMTNRTLISDLEKLFESFIQTIASAIDDKSPYTARHCEKVPVIAEMLARAAKESDLGDLKHFDPTTEEMNEIRMAAWMHDCGKVVTPEHVVDKTTKLETIVDRIRMVELRMELVRKEWEIEQLKKKTSATEGSGSSESEQETPDLDQRLRQLEEDIEFIRKVNKGEDFMTEQRLERLREIGKKYWWTDGSGVRQPLFDADELYNLSIPRGTLTQEQRRVINHHVVVTKKMLSALPFPKHLRHVPEMAGSHHETMNGTGYPEGLKREQMSIGARIMAIADIFEALTAADRPYKPAKTLSESLKILGFMKKSGHIDPDLFQVFMDRKIYLEYAKAYLSPGQIDEVPLGSIPGYVARAHDANRMKA
ncbi:MAG: GAF domain-containing protein [Magnetococcales bacterium]|nr:GAF domain-containing protein [Magnetococcales bacterium]